MSSDLIGLIHIANIIEEELLAEDVCRNLIGISWSQQDVLADLQHPVEVPQTTNETRKSTGADPHPQGFQMDIDLDDCMIPQSQEAKLEAVPGWDKRPLQSPSSSSNNTKGNNNNMSIDTSMAESPRPATNSIKKKRLEWADIDSQDPLTDSPFHVCTHSGHPLTYSTCPQLKTFTRTRSPFSSYPLIETFQVVSHPTHKTLQSSTLNKKRKIALMLTGRILFILKTTKTIS